MTDVDEHLLTFAKLREVATGDLDGDERLGDIATYGVEDPHRSTLQFLEANADQLDASVSSFAETELGQLVTSTLVNEAASQAVQTGDAAAASAIVGVTETSFDGSTLEVTAALLERLRNDDAPTFVSGAGDPESGKTNTLFKLVSMTDHLIDDLMVISNVRSWDRTDVVVRSMHDLVVTLLEHRTQPKAVVIDEASTHFDARTYREEVANQWTPAAKRMAKMGVVFCGLICHSGKDLHPEAKRLTNLAYWKHSKQEASWFEEWQGDADYPRSPLFPGVVERLEIYFGTYDPDEPATWSWDLRPGLFEEYSEWPNLLDHLNRVGRQETPA